MLSAGVAALTLASCSSSGPHPTVSGSTHQLRHPVDRAVPVAPAGTTLVATTHGAIAGYAAPNGKKTVLIPATWHGAVSSLPVVRATPGWVDVRLAQRPNGSTAWVRDTDVTFTATPYKILIDLKTTSLILFKDDKPIFGAPLGIGTPTDPTPTGQFFVAFFAAAPSSGYGPFVIVSSGHSNAISDWESSGDALMAIHGPLDADAAIGTHGARVSHGCVRLHVADLVHLRNVPAGSPIDVVAS
jgi:lipoprotein-anchoring transpeptidase ErfK/SrfK